ncbi:MAG: two-component regulator propeller domain-containing protein [Ferruginibacter sp.]
MLQRCFHGFFVCLLFCAGNATAQQAVFKTFSFKEGLNTYGINKTIQDKYGFIWIATQDGVYRFNGKSFEVFKSNSGIQNNLAGNYFFDIVTSGNGNIYAADFNKGIDIINPLDFKVQKLKIKYGTGKADQLPNLWLKRIHIDSDNNTWIGTNNFLAYRKSDESNYTIINNLPGFSGSINILFIKPLPDGHVAVGVSGYGILVFDTRSFTMKKMAFYVTKDKQFETDVKDIVYHKDTLFIISNKKIVIGKFNNSGWQYISEYTFKDFNSLVVNCATRDREGKFWIGTNSGLINVDMSSGKYFLYRASLLKKRWLQDNTINHLMLDRENNLWVSTSKALQMISLTTNGFRYFSGDDGISDHMDHIYSIVPGNDSVLYTTATDGLYETDIISGSTKKIKGSSSLGLVHYIEKINENFWVVSSDMGMYGYNPKRSELSQDELLKLYPEWTSYKKHYFNNSIRTGNVSYWASEEQEGLLKWDMVKHSITQFKAGKPHSGGITENHIHNIKADRAGFLWLLTDNTLEKFDPKIDSVVEIIKDTRKETDITASIFFDMFDNGKQYWFGSFDAGLNGYNKKDRNWTQITENDGLPNNSIYGILPESDSIIWVSTNRGISRVNCYTRSCSSFFYEDGLQDNSFDEKSSLQIGRKLYFGGINGFTEIDLEKMRDNKPAFPVYIYKLEYYDNDQKKFIHNLSWNNLEFPSGTNTITIYLAALTYSNNHKIKFSYKIEGLQNDFIDVGDDNLFTLNALGYGNYNIHIRYRNVDGSYVENALQLSLKIQPRWYQQWWFYLLLVLAGATLLYSLYRYRIRQIQKQHEIRKNIATDLHDDLGSTLNSVKVFTNLAISGVKQEESLQQVKENLTEATMSLRDMIWVLDDSLDTVDELITRLKQFAIPVAAASNIEAIIKADSEVNGRQLSKEEKRNLFLICKEAINNSKKYSGASRINVDITASGKKIQIIMADNGKGFNVDEVKKGYGLKNMQYRAEQIKYKVALISSAGNGTQITIFPS